VKGIKEESGGKKVVGFERFICIMQKNLVDNTLTFILMQ